MNYQEFKNYIDMMVSDYESGADFYDYAHECADGSEHVIYTAKAWDLVTMIKAADSNAYYDAQQTVEDMGYEVADIDNGMVITAYAIIYNAMIENAPKEAAC